MSCQRFVYTDKPDMDWICVCGHDTDWHGMSPSSPGGPCAACAEAPATPYTEQETTNG
jgi:hypothetical protein